MADPLVVSAGVPEVIIGHTAPAPAGAAPAFSGKWEDMAKDMAALEKESQPAQPAAGQPPAAATATPTPSAAPVIPAAVAVPALAAPQVAAPTPAQPEAVVPEKFRGPDGKLDQEKLLKSYVEAERELKRAQNARQAPAQQGQAPAQAAAPVQPAPVAPGQLTPFELQVAQDIFSGGGFTEQQAISMARVQVKMAEARHQADTAATLSKVNQFEQSLAEQNSRRELASLATDNPWVLTPEGFQQIQAIQAEKPWMFRDSPTPFADAVEVLLGRKTRSSPAGLPGQVPMPTPAGVQQAAPPLPATPAPSTPQPITLNTQAEIEAYVKTLTPAQEAEFWKKSGLKWGTPQPFRAVF